ncbi:MAG: FHA domain-containing protein [Gammaproteobacteria bacterium]
MAKIIVSRDQQILQEVELNKPRMTLGRHPACDIVIGDRAVSAQHACFNTVGEDVFIEDMESTNGTYVNGRKVGRQLLVDGDHIALARFQISFVKGVPGRARPPVVGTIEVTSGANAGKLLTLTKPVSTLGRPGVQVVAITRQSNAYYFQHMDGKEIPIINGKPVEGERRLLAHGDKIELIGTNMVFRLTAATP